MVLLGYTVLNATLDLLQRRLQVIPLLSRREQGSFALLELQNKECFHLKAP